MSKPVQLILLTVILTLIWLPPDLFIMKLVAPLLSDGMKQALATEEIARSFGKECKSGGQCGDITRIECWRDNETVNLYLKADKTVLAECRECCETNRCLHGQCPKKCPPGLWKCAADNAGNANSSAPGKLTETPVEEEGKDEKLQPPVL